MISEEDKEIIKQIGKYKYNQMKEQNLIPSKYLEYLQLKEEEKELRKILGDYKYRKMKKLGLSYNEFLQYEIDKKEERKLKNKIGYADFNKMKELGLNYEEYKKYKKEQKLKKYERKKEKDKIRFKTIRYIERYCNLELQCQICKEKAEIHHPNYNNYLKINLLCKKHHTALHNFELIPPQIINLEEITIKKPALKEKQEYIKQQLENMKTDVLENEYTYRDLYKKYGVSDTTIKKYFLKENNYKELERKIKENSKRKNILKSNSNKDNPLLKYKQMYKLTSKQLSDITQIPLPTIRAIEIGKTKIKNITEITKQKLSILNELRHSTKRKKVRIWKN